MEIIVFLERDTLRAELRRSSFEQVWRDYGSTRPEEVLERLEGATVVNKLPLGADVLSVEPPRKGNPLLDPAAVPNLIVTPHVAWLAAKHSRRSQTSSLRTRTKDEY
jgi:hypothetical protein